MEHSPIGASSYVRWKACPGSVNLSRGLDSPESPEAVTGTMAHEMAALWIKNGLCPKTKFPLLEQEDIDAIEVYVDFVNTLKSEPGIQFWIEERVDLSDFYPELFGTADFICYSKQHQKLIICDYKHGAGLPVEVKKNPQLQYYGAGAMYRINLPVKSVELVVVQPRCAHSQVPIRKWQTTPKNLEDFLDQLVSDAKKTADIDAPLAVGDHCRFCPASAVNCPAIRERSLALACQSFSSLIEYSPEKLSEVLRMLPTMESWIKNVKGFAVSEAQNGRTPPGFKIVGKRPQRKWKPEWSGERLAQEFGLKPPEMFDTKMKSPAQVERMVDKKMKDHVDNFVDKVSSGVKLVEDNDPSPALLDSEIDSFTIFEI